MQALRALGLIHSCASLSQSLAVSFCLARFPACSVGWASLRSSPAVCSPWSLRRARWKPALSKLLAEARLARSGLGILRRTVVTARNRRHDLLLLRRLVSIA